MKNQAYKRGIRLSITISPQASEAIDALLMTGLNGFTRAEVAQRLLYEAIRERLTPKVRR